MIKISSVVTKNPAARGAGMEISYGWQKTDAGELLIAACNGNLCYLGMNGTGGRGRAEQKMKSHFPAAAFSAEKIEITLAAKIVKAWREKGSVNVILHGTPFQVAVWRALADIPRGSACTYSDIARKIKKPRAVRAVGTAVGANPVSLLVPCHRVLPAAGGVGNYGWGADVKKALLKKEKEKVS